MVTESKRMSNIIISIFVYIGTKNSVCLVMPKIDVTWNKRAISNKRKPSPLCQTQSDVILET